MGGLAARFQLAAATAGVGGKGIKSIADVAKPAIKAKGGLNALLTRSPLDGALTESTRAITDARRAMAEGEINLNKLYALDHDGMMTARGLLVGSNKAITKLISASEALMTIADEARKKLEDDKKALRDAGNQSIRQLTAQREMLATTLLAELACIEQDTTFSIVALLGANQKLERDVALGHERKKQVEEMLGSSLGDLGTKHTQYVADHEKYVANAERTEERLSAEIGRLCGVVEHLKLEMARQARESTEAYNTLQRNMSNALADKQQAIHERDTTILELRATLSGTTSSLNSKLHDLAREKAEREQRLEKEKQELAESGRRATMELDQRLSMLRIEKEQKEQAMAQELERSHLESVKQAETLKSKIEKMRKLQELALGGLAGEDGSPQTTGKPKAPSTRGRQLLYFEALKNKNAEKSSISWRGNDVWAHEQIKQGT
ncbi:hypothetical protein Ctob_005955 [Chrysochromulina tobinii]|uniref:Uncharacterized protein n=1 Tax=Chrysochromulina tobinii TaxID=1460289 RepID=A0A0M0JKT0_9EUKA|nr:hypothetical protein Ctob_005955 [Chrysochromulina tobinii]|eukprot:KOO27179.1 hypothetical protein Ctob_005955 [Chrysochromulina sp. CCMP291]